MTQRINLDNAVVRELLRGVLLMLTSIVAGMQIYDSPPESMSMFLDWVWQPFMQGSSIVLASLMAALGFSALDQRKGRH